jgi:hypothetical protein
MYMAAQIYTPISDFIYTNFQHNQILQDNNHCRGGKEGKTSLGLDRKGTKTHLQMRIMRKCVENNCLVSEIRQNWIQKMRKFVDKLLRFHILELFSALRQLNGAILYG